MIKISHIEETSNIESLFQNSSFDDHLMDLLKPKLEQITNPVTAMVRSFQMS